MLVLRIGPRLPLVLAFMSAALACNGRAEASPVRPPRRDAHTDCYGDPLPPGAIARLGTVRWRAPHGVGQMTFVPGGRFLATNGSGALSVWDRETGRVVRTISTDGTKEGGGFDGRFAFTPDGKRILSAMSGGRRLLLLWEFSSGKLLRQSPGLDGILVCLAIRSDGRMAACANVAGDVFVWQVGKNVVRRVVAGDRRTTIHSLAFAGEGKHLVVLPHEGGVIRRIDVVSGGLVKAVDLEPCVRAAVAPREGTVATYSYEDQLYLHDTSTGEKRCLPLKETDAILDLSFSPDGRTLLVMNRRAEVVEFWDTARGQLQRRLHVSGLAPMNEDAELLLSEDGQRLASHEEHCVVSMWDAGTGRPCLRLPGHTCPPLQVTFSPDGKEVVSYVQRDQPPGAELYRWDATTGKVLACGFPDASKKGLRSTFHDWCLAPGGRHLAARDGPSICLYESSTGKRLVLPDKAAPDSDCYFSPDGRVLVTIGADQNVRQWDVTTGKLLRRLELEKKNGPIAWLRLTPDGKTLVTGENWRKIHLWDAANGKRRATLTLPADREPFQAPQHVWWETALSPDGRYLFASNAASWVWDLVAHHEIGPFERDEHAEETAGWRPVAVSPDGRLVAWFDQARKLRLYEVSTGRIVHRFEQSYSCIAFAPSGWRLATGCNADASVLIWDLPLLFRTQPLPGKDNNPESLWAFLASDNAMQAHRALWRLAALPEADTFLADRLFPVKGMPPEQLRALLADLGSVDFATREKAERTLAAAGGSVRTAIAEALAGAKDAEVRRRLARLQARLQPWTPEGLRQMRAVMALEARGTAEARRLLRRLATGLSEARLTQEARAALERLPRRPGSD